MTAWIEMIPEGQATGALRELYEEAQTPHGSVDNVMKVHSLRPQTMRGHLVLYRSVLHHSDNTLPAWLMEVVASWVSILNRCDYSLTHHFMNARRLIDDDERADRIYAALQAGSPETEFQGRELAMLVYAARLTVSPAEMQQDDIEALRREGCEDGEILELNQVIAYFNYSNRLLNGLGVTTEGDDIGYYSEAE